MPWGNQVPVMLMLSRNYFQSFFLIVGVEITIFSIAHLKQPKQPVKEQTRSNCSLLSTA